jgi:hypothetical protein
MSHLSQAFFDQFLIKIKSTHKTGDGRAPSGRNEKAADLFLYIEEDRRPFLPRRIYSSAEAGPKNS